MSEEKNKTPYSSSGNASYYNSSVNERNNPNGNSMQKYYYGAPQQSYPTVNYHGYDYYQGNTNNASQNHHQYVDSEAEKIQAYLESYGSNTAAGTYASGKSVGATVSSSKPSTTMTSWQGGNLLGVGGGGNSSNTNANANANIATATSTSTSTNKKHFYRAGGTEIWEDQTLAEWDPDDYRIFCGDLGLEVTDEQLLAAFSAYPSVERARVIRDKRSGKSKGYGFVGLKDPEDYRLAMKEMNGKYVGSRPIKLKKSTWKDRNVSSRTMKKIKKSHPY